MGVRHLRFIKAFRVLCLIITEWCATGQGSEMSYRKLLRTMVVMILLLVLGACGGSGGGGSRAGEFTCTWNHSNWDNGCLWGP